MAKLYDEVLSQVNIRDVLQYYNIPIIKNKILCPFHDDHSPSMSIDDQHNIVKCFSCGEGGNPITFIYKYEEKVNHHPITFNEAVKKAAEIANLSIDFSFLDHEIDHFQYTSNGRTYDDDQKSLLKLNEYFETVYLNELIANEAAQSYVSERGISLDVAKSLGFGFAANDIIKRIADRRTNINLYQLEQLGLITPSQDGKSFKERLKDRLIIPIKDEKGNTVAFSGRAMHGEEPKYLHVAESPVFYKSNVLYNYDKAKTYAYRDQIYIVEGYMDVVGAKMMGIDSVVALMGTEITDEHIALLKKCNCKLILALDNDQPGKDAMSKLIPRLWKKGFDLEVTDLSLLEKQYQHPIKDFGDAASMIENRLEIEKATIPAFSFLLDHKYFKDQVFDARTIHIQYQKIKEDHILETTYEKIALEEYLMQRSAFSREDIQEICTPRSLKEETDPLEIMKQQAMKQVLFQSFSALLEQDELKISFYTEHTALVQKDLWKLFSDNPRQYLKQDGSLDVGAISDQYFADHKAYHSFSLLHGFAFQDVFDHSYVIQNDHPQQVLFTAEQKEKMIAQYKATLSDEEKSSLKDIEDLYVINKVEDLSSILPELASPLLRQTIEDKLLTTSAVQYFKYSTVFDQSMLPYVSKDYLNKDQTNFKSILLIPNIGNSLELNEGNIYKEDFSVNDDVLQEKEEELSKENTPDIEKIPDKKAEGTTPIAKEIQQDRLLFSKDAILKESDAGYLVQTSDPSITIFAPKRLCYWKDEHQTHIVIIPKTKAFSRNVTTLSKYVNNEYEGRATIDELKMITKFIVHDKKEPQKKMAACDLQDTQITYHGEYAWIKAIHDHEFGIFKVNKNYIKDSTLMGKADFAYQFYPDAGKSGAMCTFHELRQAVHAYGQMQKQEEMKQDLDMEGL